MLHMRPSRVLNKLRAGEDLNCFKLNLGASSPLEIGLDPAMDR